MQLVDSKLTGYSNYNSVVVFFKDRELIEREVGICPTNFRSLSDVVQFVDTNILEDNVKSVSVLSKDNKVIATAVNFEEVLKLFDRMG